MVAPYPKFDPNNPQWPSKINFDAKEEMDTVMEIITSIRSIRQELNIAHSVPLKAIVKPRDEAGVKKVEAHKKSILALSKAVSLDVSTVAKRPPQSATAVHAHSEVYVPLEGLIDIGKEKERIEKDLAKIKKELAMLDKKFEDENFVKNAPAEVLEKDKAAHAELTRRVAGMEDSIKWLGV